MKANAHKEKYSEFDMEFAEQREGWMVRLLTHSQQGEENLSLHHRHVGNYRRSLAAWVDVETVLKRRLMARNRSFRG